MKTNQEFSSNHIKTIQENMDKEKHIITRYKE